MSTSPDDRSPVTTTFVIPTVYARRVAESLRDLGLVLAPFPSPPDDDRLGTVHIAVPDREVVALLAAMSERYVVNPGDRDVFGARVTVEEPHAAPWLPRFDLMPEEMADLTWPGVLDPDGLALAMGSGDDCATCAHPQRLHVAGPYESPDSTQQRLVVICRASGPDDPPCECLTRLDPSQAVLPE